MTVEFICVWHFYFDVFAKKRVILQSSFKTLLKSHGLLYVVTYHEMDDVDMTIQIYRVLRKNIGDYLAIRADLLNSDQRTCQRSTAESRDWNRSTGPYFSVGGRFLFFNRKAIRTSVSMGGRFLFFNRKAIETSVSMGGRFLFFNRNAIGTSVSTGKDRWM